MGKFTHDDMRKQVKNTDIHPYNGIGIIVAKLYNHQTKQYMRQGGTAFIVSPKIIITCANVIYLELQKKIADDIQFFPAQLLKKNQVSSIGIKARVLYLRDQYLDKSNKLRREFDFAILELLENNIITSNQILEMDFNYNCRKEDVFNISAYNFSNILYFQENRLAGKQSDLLYYKHTTDSGYSGSPLLLKKEGKYVVVGIHKGTLRLYNYGLLLKCLNYGLVDNSVTGCCQTFIQKLFIQKDHLVCELRRQNIELKQKLEKGLKNIKDKQIEIITLNQKMHQLSSALQKNQKKGQIKQFSNLLLNKPDSWSLNVLESSSILDNQGLKLLVQWLIKPIKKIQHKFKASDHDFKIEKYFQLCGNLQNTIIIAKTNKGRILGGFTPLSFKPSGDWTSEYDYEDIKDQSNSSFLFLLSQKQKFQLIKNKDAITRWRNKDCINFCSTLYIVDQSYKDLYHQSNRNQFCLYEKPPNYNTSKYSDCKQSYLKVIGQQSQDFKIVQWQVYQVSFL